MSRKITDLKGQKENKYRVNVYLEGEFAFGLSLTLATGLKLGQVLTEAEITALKEADAHQQAYQKALHFLSFRARSRQEMEDYLMEKGIGAAEINTTLTRLHQERYLDDEAFARAWVESRTRVRPRSSAVLRQELRQKGVEAALITDILAEVDEDLAAWAALEPKLRQWQSLDERAFQQKVTGFLGRRGFGYALIRRVGERAWRAAHDEEENDE